MSSSEDDNSNDPEEEEEEEEGGESESEEEVKEEPPAPAPYYPKRSALDDLRAINRDISLLSTNIDSICGYRGGPTRSNYMVSSTPNAYRSMYQPKPSTPKTKFPQTGMADVLKTTIDKLEQALKESPPRESKSNTNALSSP